MDNNLIIYLIFALVVVFIMSFLLGFILAKIVILRKNKKLIKDLNEVLEGKRENFIEIDGVKYPAEKFRLINDEGEETLISLKGGQVEQEQNANKKNLKKERRETLKNNNSIIGENSRSSGEKKRNIGRRDRRRRFG